MNLSKRRKVVSMTRNISFAFFIALFSLTTTAQPTTQMSGGGMGMGGQAQTQPAQMDKMNQMAEAMTAMAQTCQTMMQKEDRTMRYLVSFGVAFVCLVAVALLLFVILEIEWIIYWRRRLRAGSHPQ